MTNKQPQQQYEIGMVGLGVMGRNFLLNMAYHGFSVAGYNKGTRARSKPSAKKQMSGMSAAPTALRNSSVCSVSRAR
jgi:6-phosphogluconate dehydrogenase